MSEEFEGVPAAISKLPHLDSLEIGFAPECAGIQKNVLPEPASERKAMLKLIFQSIKDRAANPENKSVRKLTIINLQNYPLPEFTSSYLFRDIMCQLDELHVEITEEFNEDDVWEDYGMIEMRTFPPHFCSNWLGSMANNLRALSIYKTRENWGPLPGYFNFSGIHFPNLKARALGHYTLAHDNDVDWILSIKSLRKLILDECMISAYIRIEPQHLEEWIVRTHDWTDGPCDDTQIVIKSFAYGGQWAQCFDRISSELPNLVDFRFHGGRYGISGDFDVNYRDVCGVNIFAQRYTAFDEASIGWIRAFDDGTMRSSLATGEFPTNKHEENLEPDQKSLERLLAVIKARR